MASFSVTVSDREGRELRVSRYHPSMASARQAMLDDAGVSTPPRDVPFFVPQFNVLEGWFIGGLEYCIGLGPEVAQ